MKISKEGAHKLAGWSGVLLAAIGLGTQWVESNAQIKVAQLQAAKAAAYAKEDVTELIETHILTQSSSVALCLERTKWVTRELDRTDVRLQQLETKKPAAVLRLPSLLPPPPQAPAPVLKSPEELFGKGAKKSARKKMDRVQETAEQYMKEAF